MYTEKNLKRRIDSVYKIFALRLSLENKDSDVTWEGYQKYIERLYVWFLGYGNEEIYSSLLGLKKAYKETSLDTVKSVVFHIIHILEEGG